MNRKERERKVHKKVAHHYDKVREKNKNSRYYSKKWLKHLFGLARRRSGKILDVGCGTGILYEVLPKNMDYTGIDLSEDMIKVGKRRYPKIDLRMMDCEKLNFKDETFDVILARSILHHVPHPEKAVKEIKRCLKNDGIVVISEPKKTFISEGPRYIAKKFTGHFDEDHTHFKEDFLEKIIKKSGLRIVKRDYFGYLAYPFGFPDIIKALRFMPHPLFKVLYKADNGIAKVPLVKKLGWHMMFVARKKKTTK